MADSANATIPKYAKKFLKFWWNQELDSLKNAAIASAKLWKDAGKPKAGPVFAKYKQDKLLYKKRIREERAKETSSFTNDLHDALLKKSGHAFWKCWRAKFGNKNSNPLLVDGKTDEATITRIFAEHFQNVCKPFSEVKNSEMKAKFETMKAGYHTPLPDKDKLFDTQLLSELIAKMDNGKAAGLDDLSCEHLKYCHPIAIVILCKLFNIFLLVEYLPRGFGLSYTVPIPKCDNRSRGLSVDDFRGISISPVVSKLFELCILDRFSDYFQTSDQQFGFKKHLGCRHAVYCVRNVIDHYTSNRSTVNVCSVDLSKAFDKMNHFALFIKLMERRLPNQLLNIFIMWFDMSFTCVRWGGHYSFYFRLVAGVRQGGVLSPYFFAIYIDCVVDKINRTNVGCYISGICTCIFLYADDIILMAPSVEGLQRLLTVCEDELITLDMKINVKKSVCIRFGARYDHECANLRLRSGDVLKWTVSCRYLGIYLVSARSFKCCFDVARAKFYRAFNSIFGKVGRLATETVILNLLSSKCLPVLLYCTEACPLLSRDLNSMSFAMNRVLMKIFCSRSSAVVEECRIMFGVPSITDQIHRRKIKFLQKFCESDNCLCALFAGNASRECASVC